MTVSVQVPYLSLLANGTMTDFVFNFGYIETLDVYVRSNGITLTQFSDYTIESTDIYAGGTVVFQNAPAANAIIEIIRITTKSQEIDYESFTSFPADTHEFGMDKDMYILQEMINGAYVIIDGTTGEVTFLTFDLDVALSQYILTITNSGGTDADLPMWVSDTTAGVYAAIVDLEANIPADGAASSEPDGVIYIGI
jgi:hypothetical protein